MDLGLAGRACLITGGSRGIGLETARMLRAEGAKVLLVARDAGQLADAAEGLDGGEEDVATLPLDVTEPDAGEQMLGAALEAFGGLDVLVNNAGAGRPRDPSEASADDWRAQYELSVMAPLRAMKAIAPALAERGWGRIVNVCSTAAKRPSQALPGYSVAKAAELSLSRLFADRYASEGVMVNAVCPAVAGRGDRDRAVEGLPAGGPDDRLAAAEAAGAIVFLCSERASYVSGAAWSADAGTVRVII